MGGYFLIFRKAVQDTEQLVRIRLREEGRVVGTRKRDVFRLLLWLRLFRDEQINVVELFEFFHLFFSRIEKSSRKLIREPLRHAMCFFLSIHLSKSCRSMMKRFPNFTLGSSLWEISRRIAGAVALRYSAASCTVTPRDCTVHVLACGHIPVRWV
jgi:hypothetical protein